MTITVRAVYEHGILRPLQPLALPEGDTFDVTIGKPEPAGPISTPPTPEEEDYVRRLQAAGSLDEMFAVMATAPPLPEGYDLFHALDANRRAAGERLLFPQVNNENAPSAPLSSSMPVLWAFSPIRIRVSKQSRAGRGSPRFEPQAGACWSPRSPTMRFAGN